VHSGAPIPPPPPRRSRFWRIARRVAPLLLLLFISLFLLTVVSVRATRAMLEARNSRQIEAGAALGVRPWMTLPYIARVYGVPEGEVFGALGLADTPQRRRAPVRAIAEHEGRNLDADIATLNALVDARRGTPVPPRSPARPRATP